MSETQIGGPQTNPKEHPQLMARHRKKSPRKDALMS